MNNNALSIQKLNEILPKLHNTPSSISLGQFSSVDIAFIAGLMLDYEIRKNDRWEKNEIKYYLTDENEGFKVRQYLQQYKELYGVDWKEVFTGFSYALQDEQKQRPDVFSKFFTPILYITENYIDYFFGKKEDERVKKLKNVYIRNFSILDFINKKARNSKYTNYEKEIKDRLKKYPPIFTFIFIVASKNLANKEDEAFEQRKDYVEKLWLFTQDYVRGLYELAKNIVEHSGQDGQKGKGIITIRAYSKEEADKTRNLETHVFDYGKKGIIPTLVEYTTEKSTGNQIRNQKIKNCYKLDSQFFKNNSYYTLEDYIENGKNLQQQQFRHTSHYGISKLYKLIETPLNGEIFISSSGNNSRDYFGNNADKVTLKQGSHYYFKIPFIQENFKNIVAKPFSKENQTAMLGETASLEFLSNLKRYEIKLSQIDQILKMLPENSMILVTIDVENITKQNIDHVYNSFDKLNKLKDNNRIAVNLQDKINDVSILLRFLSYLTFEYKQPFLIYNINYEIYKEVLSDNKEFHESRQSEAYWHEERAILLFVKTDKEFYFADILYGQDREEFLYVNNVVSKTFPNTITLLQEINDKEKGTITSHLKTITSNQNLQQFFYPKSNNLLPFDALLKNQDSGNRLFVSNLTTILQNPLFNRKKTYGTLNEYIENFDGFRIENTHFKIGTKIHSEDFFYAKRLFQNSFYTARLAMHLAIEIKEKVGNTNQKITLAGYEMYSELLLSLVEKFLIDFGFREKENEVKRVNHFITQSDDENFKFLPNDIFKEYLKNYRNRLTIIIVPIAATGNTIDKIEKDIKKQIYKEEKNINKKSEQEARQLSETYQLFEPRYTILLAQDPNSKFDNIRQNKSSQLSIVNLSAKWYEIKNCPLCYGTNEKEESVNTIALFETDKSSLTPALIFDNPKGKVKVEAGTGEEVVNKIPFDRIKFRKSLKYRKVFRNNSYRIYYIDSDKYIEENLSDIKSWLNNTVKETLKLSSTDKIIIVAPCHESNSQFLNLVNEIVFASSATIIHYQNNVDFAENFILLNENHLGKDMKLFYVDDSLITGKHFYEVFDLLKKVLSFTAAIFLNDKSEPFTHSKIVDMSNIFFAFANFNQPPALNLLGQRPLEYERQRYEMLAKVTLHDVIIKTFLDKADSLNPQKQTGIKEGKTVKEKEIRRLKCFEATHKIYDYFANPSKKEKIKIEENKYEIDKIVNFKPDDDSILFSDYQNPDNVKVLLKILSQYPFNLYKSLREKAFIWLKEWLSKIKEPNRECFQQADYANFQTMKFLLRRATLLGNYQVLEKDFLQKILIWFIKIDKFYSAKDKPELSKNRDESDDWERNLQDFPIYILRNYVEMIHKNGWIAYHIKTNIEELQTQFMESKQGAQFLRMLQICFALVIDDFYEMIVKEQRISWRDLFRYVDGEENKAENQRRFNTVFIDKTDRIIAFFNNNLQLLETTKYQILKETFLDNSNAWKNTANPLVNFLWIKQLLYVDCIAKDSHFPKEIGYQTKIDAIIKKMIDFFPVNKNVRAFFVVTDGKQKPYLLSQENHLLNSFNEEFNTDQQIKNLSEEIKRLERHENIDGNITSLKTIKKALEYEKERHKTQVLIDFLNGIDCNTCIAPETTAEYYRDRLEQEIQNEFDQRHSMDKDYVAVKRDLFSNPSPNFDSAIWRDAYKREKVNLQFMPTDTKWLYLVRISKYNEDRKDFEALGLLGFYSNENLYNSAESLFPKKLLMLLRRDIGEFIIKHHKNDEFAGLIQQKEKADYQFMLRHGINEYKTPIKKYFDKIYALIPSKNDESEKLKRYYDFELNHLTNKIDLMQMFSKFDPDNPNHFDTFNLQEILDKFNSDYEYILKFERKGLYYLSEDNNISDYIQIYYPEDNSDWLSTEEINFPNTILDEMIFELVYNIRKHVLNVYSAYIKKSKLNIYLDFVKNGNTLYFKISNNYCEKKEDYFNRIYNNNKLDGLNLINCILKKAKIGILKVTKTEASDLKDKIIDIYVPLKRIK